MSGATTRAAPLALAALLAAGCGARVVPIDPTPEPQLPHWQLDPPPRIEVRTSAANLEQRNRDPRVVGVGRSGLRNLRARIVVPRPPAEWMTEVVSTALLAAGFRLAEPGAGDFVFETTLQRFRVDEFATGGSLEYARAYVWLEVVVRDGRGAVVFVAAPDIQTLSSPTDDASSENQWTLQRAVERAIEAVFHDPHFEKALTTPTPGVPS